MEANRRAVRTAGKRIPRMPKPFASEGGTELFEVKYFEKKALLLQTKMQSRVSFGNQLFM